MSNLDFYLISLRPNKAKNTVQQSSTSVGEMVDAVFYLGELKREMTVDQAALADKAWLTEMTRRAKILGEGHLLGVK